MNNQRDDGRVLKISLIILLVCGLLFWGMIQLGKGDEDRTFTCEVCHREYVLKGDGSNYYRVINDVKSIRKTNMCDSCYRNYTNKKDAIDGAVEKINGN